MKLGIPCAAVLGILYGTPALGMSSQPINGSALERLSAALNLGPQATISNVGRAFGLSVKDRPTRWAYGPLEHDLWWKNTGPTGSIKSILFAEKDAGSFIEVWIGKRDCLTLTDISDRFGAKPEYFQMPVPDSGLTTDSDQIEGLQMMMGGRSIYIDGLALRPAAHNKPAATMSRCLKSFNIDGEPPVFIDKAPTS